MATDSDNPAAAAKPRARAEKTAAATTPTPAPSAANIKPTRKSETVIKLLLRAKGATPVELIAATDWQPHSLRAFLSGLRKKGRVIAREERKGGGTAYRIVAVRQLEPGEAAAGELPVPESLDAAASTVLKADAIGRAAPTGEDA